MKPKKAGRKFEEVSSNFLFIGISPYLREHNGRLCVHLPKENFTDALFQEDCQTFHAALAHLITRKWEEITESSHYHPILEQDEREKLGDYLGLSTNETNKLLTSNIIYQISLDEKGKFRVYGIKSRIGNKDHFEILLFDPNHLFHPNPKKSYYPFGAEAICLMDCLSGNKGERCPKLNEEPKDKRLIKKT